MKIRAAAISDLEDGESKLLLIQGREVALFRVRGEFFALDNACPHQGGPLGEGPIEEDRVICPWHHWDFNLKTGESSLGTEICVRAYETQVEGEEIFITGLKPKS